MRVLARGVGAHGLLHIGTGDWNDAFDRVGAQGRGESVWLTWFFAVTARKFAALVGGRRGRAALPRRRPLHARGRGRVGRRVVPARVL